MNKNGVKFHKKEDYNKTQGILIIILLIIVLITNLFFYLMDYSKRELLNDDSNLTQKMKIIGEMIENNYLFMDKVPNEQIIDGTLKGYVSSLGDPYTRYISNKDYKEFTANLSGEFGGIGVTIQNDGTNVVPETGMQVVDLSEGKGAQDAGIEKNDKIIEVDGKNISGMNMQEAVDMIKGKEGTDVSLKVVKENGETKDVKVTRKKIEYPKVSAQVLNDHIAYIAITQFSNNIVEQFDKAYEKIKDGTDCVIIDLRNDTGGSLSATVDLMGRFLPEGSTVVKLEKKNFETEYKTEKAPYSINKPVVVLTNYYSASASEIFASAIRDNKVGTIIGEKTYGKGLVQETINIDDSSMLIVTIAKYLTPSGEDINQKGVAPDIEVKQEYNGTDDLQLKKAVEYLETEK